MRALNALFAVAGLLAGGCSAGPPYQVSAPPLDYRELVSWSRFAAKLRAERSYGPLEISGLQQTVLGQPGDWRTCLRTTKSGRLEYFAVFFRGGAIEDVRQSVAIDRCEKEPQFLPLPPPPPTSTPKPKQKPKSTS